MAKTRPIFNLKDYRWAVDGVVATGIGPDHPAVYLKIVAGVDCVVIGVCLNISSVDEERILAFNGLAVGLPAALRAVALHIPAVDDDVAVNLETFGQPFPVVGAAASSETAARMRLF